ncbi:polypyrimidine binding protein [Trypanosoma rangeli]|uniref:Polypyrimidine binding protein n=1 Tax=Trypanosoma rangeli TaxID=5698 RepID=A0A422N8U8_TRYRA|nr:polypyrimidine binding protein [Trypanosoma rangeli]RNF01909.1 polypyrimidine binding protein [Trypanosoma rangeli]|eukprot:RNF01909.1 polypyrimidine binding protein [Trypanosoma rangeli]
MSVVLKNIPPQCQEDDLRRALLIYGTAISTAISPHMRQATVTMRTPQEARSLLHQGCINLFGQTVTVESAPYGSNGGSPAMMTPHLGATRINVVVEKCTYPVTKEILTQVFGMVAPPLNVICGPSGPTTTGWVDYSDATTARRVMQQLNKNSIYPECCFMSLTLDRGGVGVPTMGGYATSPMSYPKKQAPQQSPLQPQQPMPFGHANYGAMPGALMPRGGMGGRGRGRGGGMGRYGLPYAVNGHMAHPPYAAAGAPYAQPPTDAVVIVSNMPETVALHDLWVLLEVYGNVNSLKRQFSSKSTVVAHFQNVYDARLAVQYLQGCPFHGATLSLKHFAGYVERGGRTEWNSGPATDPATHAVLFSSGYHHRTKPTAAFNPTGRVRPGKNLFISNLTEAITDEDIKEVFTKAGFELDGYYRKNSTVAIVSLRDIETAVQALIVVHSHQLKERFLRVTFSHFPPGPRSNGDEEGEVPAVELKEAVAENPPIEE